MPAISLITGPFLGCDIVVQQWGPDSPWAGEWAIQAAFTGANRYGALLLAEQLRRHFRDHTVLILRTVSIDGMLAIVDERPAQARAA